MTSCLRKRRREIIGYSRLRGGLSEAVELLKPMYAPEAAKKNERVLSKELFARGKRAVFMGGNLPHAAKAGVPASPGL